MSEASTTTQEPHSRTPDERARLRATSNNLVLHLHPPRVAAHAIRWSYTFGLGGLNILALLVLIGTGVLQMFAYTPTPEQAYQSVVAMQTIAPYGRFLRNLHHWSANLLIVSTALHLLRVFYTGSFRGSRRRNWWLGLCLLGLVALANFTGYLLPWDQLAYWAVTVGTSMLSYLPGGEGLRYFILGGDTVGARTLTNFYVLHIVIIPLTIVLAVVYHIWRVRKDGFSANVRATIRLTTVPHLFGREVIFGLITLCALLLWAMVVQAPLEQAADPLHPPNPNKAAWYFVGFQELLLHLHPLVGIIVLPMIIVSILVALPDLDAHPESTAIWFRARGGWRLALLGLVLGGGGMLAFIFSSELWLKRLVPPAGISNELFALAVRGVLPLLAGVGALWLLQSRLGRRGVPPSARWMVLGSVLVAAYLTLTAVGLFLRGPDMALTLFWRNYD